MDKRGASPTPETSRKIPKIAAQTIPELPTEIWSAIFGHLPLSQMTTLRCVCHRWRDIVHTKLTVSFPARLTIDSGYSPDNLPSASKVRFRNVTISGIGPWWSTFGQDVTELQISDYSEVNFESLLTMLKNTPNLKSLEFLSSNLTGGRPEEVDLRLDKLDTLVIKDFEDADFLNFFRHLSTLKSVRITWDAFTNARLITGQTMGTFLGCSQNTLEELCITCTQEILAEVVKLGGLKLKKLSLAGDELESYTGLIELFRMQPSLEYFKLLRDMGQALPNLKSLLIQGTFVDLDLLSNFPKLRTLQLKGDNDSETTLQFNGEHQLNLVEFKLKCIHFEETPLQQLKNMQNLRTLTLNLCTFYQWSDLFKALEPLNHLKTLSLIIININEPFDDDYSCDADLSHLRSLDLSECEMMPNLLATFLTRCANLRELRLHSMEYLNSKGDDAVLQVICRHMANLSALSIRDCGLSSESVRYVRENCNLRVEQLEV